VSDKGHLRLVTGATTGTTDSDAPEANIELPVTIGGIVIHDLDAPLKPNYEACYQALLADHGAVRAKLAKAEQDKAAAEQDTAAAERLMRRERDGKWESDRHRQKLRRELEERKRRYPSVGPSWVWLRDIWRLIIETHPDKPISQVALIKWCKKKVLAEKPGGYWRVDIESFKAHWAARKLPQLDWDRLTTAL
jgi:hypothetical protein